MTLTVLYPIAAWLFLLLPLLWWPMRRRPRWTQLALRAAVFGCLIVALMQPSMVRRSAGGVQLFILDQRASLGAAGRASARQALARAVAAEPGGMRRVLVQLGAGVAPAGFAERRVITDGSMTSALRAALDAVPLDTGGAITLIGDGHSTDGHWAETVDTLAARGIAVNAIAVAPAPRRAFIGDVRIAPARVGERLRVDVDVEGDGRPHRLAILGDGRTLAQSAPFEVDGLARMTLEVPADRAGFLPLRVQLDGRGGFDVPAAVQPPLRLLYLGERQTGGATALQRLLGRGFAVDQGTPAMLAGPADPARWPLVMLDDMPSARLPVAAQRRLTRAIAGDGTGLLAAGGIAAFGPGGYAGTPLGAALPVTPRQQDRQIRPSVALAIVVDSSGSMQGERLELAKQVARQTVRKLTPDDWVGVVEFYGARQWSVPMHHATDIADVERAIGRMQGQGASVLFPALEEAFYGLKDVEARYKHILVISDGGVAEDRYQQLLRHIAENRINVSTVAVGGQVDDEKSMAEWARLGRGRFYSVPDEFALVELDFHQPQTRAETGYSRGDVAVDVASGRDWWAGLRGMKIPPLAGHVSTRTRPDADTLMTAAGGDPILSSWQVGAGRVTALTTEPLGAGTATWRGWPDYGSWLARILSRTARQRQDFDVTLDRRFDRLRIAVQRLGPLNGAAAARIPAIRLVDAAGRPIRRVDAVEVRAPGLYVADIPFPAREPARVEVQDGAALARAADAAFSDVRRIDAMPAAMALPLADISRRTGGWFRDDPAATPGTMQTTGGWEATDLWPWAALLGLVLYLAEVAYRRWPSRRPAGS